jgi:flavin reductase (DIM6/NTAB) family NADH-FMN oxidoreductase RutF/DNA-binding IclR family transcriptional regulator
VDAQRFREVLGNYPTGVTVVTAMDADGFPAGMAVGSFTSVSLDPPLVAFLADKSSTSFPRIRTADSFCVNVLAADQEDVCRTFASRGGDKFASVAWTPTGSGAPRINGVAAWIDCKLESVQEAGDHYLVIGRVRELDSTGERLPLVFFQGGYGRFLPLSLVAVPEVDFVSHLRLADRCRPEMELLAAEVGAECLALTPVDDQLVVLASAGAPGGGVQFSRVGQRIPFVPPVGTLFLAWAEHDAVLGWLARSGRALSDAERDEQLTVLERVRRRGWSLEPAREFESQHESAPDDGADDEAAGRVISVPVFGVRGSVLLTLTLWGLAEADPEEVVRRRLGTLRAAAERISASLRERPV